MNIVKLQNDLKDLSDQQLYQTMQGGAAPQYLVLGEMQRRKKMRAEAASQPQQPSSVAEDIMAPPQAQGLAGMPQAPMMQMNAGGIVGFAAGKSVSGYAKGSAEACWTNPETGKSECPPAQPQIRSSKGKKFAGGREVYKDIESIESSGRQYDAQGNVLTSPKGAKGLMQIMPTTAMDPGYGARNIFQLADDLGVDYGGKKDVDTATLLLGNEMLNRAMGKEYYDAMERRFGSDDAAKAAYNAGPGRVGRSGFAESGDRDVLPEETQGYLAKSDKLKAERAERELPTQTAAEGIAALGEGKMQLTDSEKAPAQITEMYGPSWADVPADSRLRVADSYQDGAELDGEERTLFRDQGGAYDARDMLGYQYGSPTIYENTTDRYGNDNLPIRPTGDDGLMALAPKTPYGRPRGLLEGEKIVNAAEPATADSYEEIRPQQTNEYGDYLNSLDSGPSLEEQMAKGVAALAPQAPAEKPSGEFDPGFDEGDAGFSLGPYEEAAANATDPAEKARLENLARQANNAVPVGNSGYRYDAESNTYFNNQGMIVSPPVDQDVFGDMGTTRSRFEKGAKSDFEKKTKAEEKAAQEKVNEYLKESASGGETSAKASDPLTDLYEQIKAERGERTSKQDKINEFMMNAGLAMAASKNPDFLAAAAEGGLKGLGALRESKKAEAQARSDMLGDMVKLIGSRELSAAKAATAQRNQIQTYLDGIDALKKRLDAGAFDSEAERKAILSNINRLTQMYNASVGLPIQPTGSDPSQFKTVQ